MFFALPNVRDKITHLFECWLDGYRNLETVYNLYFYKSRGMLHNVFLSKAQALEEFHRSTKENSEKWGFKSRIGNLYDKYEPIMKLTGDKESFCQLALDHRDYYSHWFKKKEEKVFKDIHLDYLSRDINLLLEMCLLSQMGFTDTEIPNMVENCNTYRSYLDIGRPSGTDVFPPPRIIWKPDQL